ncbi:MAG: YggS family pyridoxal phosphate-dependent enzyme, partial [Muribaculaceae bacterium]|nr:YggS family pyridoxal phosphate-dependent enzyme [Muribaculaceae bacterium]
MATNTDDMNRRRQDFCLIADTFRQIKSDASLGLSDFDVISMGMSDDYLTAIDCGATLVRIGTDIFGPRQY